MLGGLECQAGKYWSGFVVLVVACVFLPKVITGSVVVVYTCCCMRWHVSICCVQSDALSWSEHLNGSYELEGHAANQLMKTSARSGPGRK
jgi:hypothetical protein